MRENVIEKALVERVRALGGETRKVKWIGRNGAPDRLVLLPKMKYHSTAPLVYHYPRSVWVELKAPGEKLRPNQIRENQKLQDYGMQVLTIDSLEQIDNFFPLAQ